MTDRAANIWQSTAVSAWLNERPILGFAWNGANGGWLDTATARWNNEAVQLGLRFMAQIWQVYEAGYPPPAVMAYKMRGMDAAISGLYDAWISVGTPDYAGTGYHGALATPLRDIVVIDTWET